MFQALQLERSFGSLSVATVAILILALMPESLSGQEQARDRSRTEQGQSRGSDDRAAERTGPQLGVIVAPSPSGSPLVLRVMPRSTADRVGIQHGDFIVSIGEKKVDSPEHLRTILKQMKSSDQATVVIWRSGEEREFKLDLSPQQRAGERRLARRAWLGVMIRASSDEAVEIARVYLDGPADKAGLQAGDRFIRIDGEDLSSPQAVTQHIGQLQPGTKVRLLVERDGEELTIDAEVGNLEDFHEKLFGEQFRQNFDDFHEMFDPDFDGVPERVFSFRIPTGEDDELPLRELLREMRDELREFRKEFRDTNNGGDQNASNAKDEKEARQGQ